MAVNTHRTRSPDLFSYGMVQYVLGVSIHNTEIAGKQVLWTWELEPDGKSCIFPPWNLDHCSLKLARKTFWFISLFIKTTLVMYLSFLKVISCLPFLAGKSSDSTVSPNQDNNSYGNQYSQNTFPWLLSHEMAQCILGVSLFSSDTAGKHALWTWELVTDDKSSIFLIWNLDSYFIKPSRKTPRFIFLFITVPPGKANTNVCCT